MAFWNVSHRGFCDHSNSDIDKSSKSFFFTIKLMKITLLNRCAFTGRENSSRFNPGCDPFLERNASFCLALASGYPSWRIYHQFLSRNLDILFAFLTFECLKSGSFVFWLLTKFKSSHICSNSCIKNRSQALLLHVLR